MNADVGDAGPMPRTGVWFFPDRPAPDLVDAIVCAEQAGFDEVWLGDEGPAREPFTVLAAAAARTERLTLGVGVTNPYVRHPGAAMASMATIAELGSGRTVLGVGAGGAMSLGPFGLAAEQPVVEVQRFLDVATAARDGRATDGYTPSDVAVASVAPRVSLYVGARGPRLNTLASQRADGAFVAGLPPFRFDEVIGWARSVRPIEIALYPSVAFDDDDRERHRPEMIWSLLDAPPAVAANLGVERDEIEAAAEAVRRGDPRLAASLIDDELLGQLMLLGEPADVGRRLAALVHRFRPNSIGLAVVTDDLPGVIDAAAVAFDAMRTSLEETEWSA